LAENYKNFPTCGFQKLQKFSRIVARWRQHWGILVPHNQLDDDPLLCCPRRIICLLTYHP